MKRHIKLIACILLFVFTISCCFPAFAATKKYNITVTLKSVEMVSNNHVGNEWINILYGKWKGFYK